MTRPFIIDKQIMTRLQELVEYAETHPFTMDDLLDMLNQQKPPPGDCEEHVLLLPFGYKIVYSVEQQTKGDVRHFSMSVDTDGRLPSPIVVKECMKMLGFENEMEKCMVTLEQIGPDRQAVNVWELIK